MKFEIYQGSDGQWYWRLRCIRNRKITATGGEGYFSRSNAKRAVLRHLSNLQSCVTPPIVSVGY